MLKKNLFCCLLAVLPLAAGASSIRMLDNIECKAPDARAEARFAKRVQAGKKARRPALRVQACQAQEISSAPMRRDDGTWYAHSRQFTLADGRSYRISEEYPAATPDNKQRRFNGSTRFSERNRQGWHCLRNRASEFCYREVNQTDIEK